MRQPHRFALAVLASVAPFLLNACGGGASPTSTANVVVTIANKPQSIPQGGTYTFTANVSSGTTTAVSWTTSSGAYASVGSFSPATGSPTTYTAPPSPPVYTGAGAANVPGTVTINAGEAFNSTGDTATFTITAPAVTVAASPATASVALGGTQLITAYAIGNVNNALTWQVNGVTGGSAVTGTIAAPTANLGYGIYQYTAPATMPMTGNTVTVTVISQADPTKSASTVITLH